MKLWHAIAMFAGGMFAHWLVFARAEYRRAHKLGYALGKKVTEDSAKFRWMVRELKEGRAEFVEKPWPKDLDL